MRLVQVFVPRDELDLVIETAEEAGVDYTVSRDTERGEFEALVSIPVRRRPSSRCWKPSETQVSTSDRTRLSRPRKRSSRSEPTS